MADLEQREGRKLLLKYYRNSTEKIGHSQDKSSKSRQATMAEMPWAKWTQ